jgi:GntR family negative regulator for fad regulon and positive regulator of fabA
MDDRSGPERPAVYAERALLSAILEGVYPLGSKLPGERVLADQLGVTRPTLREALQRLARDGWVSIQQGKATRVNDYWREGGLNVLSAVAQYSQPVPREFVPNLLEVRLALAPAYARAAVERSPEPVRAHLAGCQDLEDAPDPFAVFDWGLHRTLAAASGNPVFTLILNGFAPFYEAMARLYFAAPHARDASRRFYGALLAAAQAGDPGEAEQVTRAAMTESLSLW